MKKRKVFMVLVGFLSFSIAVMAGWSLATHAFPNLFPSPSPTAIEEWALADVPTDWIEIIPGLELRQISIREVPTLLVRADLDLLSLDLAYDPANPQTVADWRESKGAFVAVNAGFFEADYTTSGIMMIRDGVYGRSYTQRDNAGNLGSGMFLLEGGQASIRQLDDGFLPRRDTIQLGLESFPVLIFDSTPMSFNLPDRAAKRTSLAVDEERRVIFIVLQEGEITLYTLRDELFALSEELGLVSAMNLDGGPSTGVSVSAGGIFLEMNSAAEVSSVFTLSR
jgi:uncharacterized protein YigE (DUF2233 family)